ncbi:MAG: dihydrolipoyl dehydrogenase [Candidatus Hodarchaeales archaeon]|jgi:dihydrolipoamide dehydrogenase
MKNYDVIMIGSGSAKRIIDRLIKKNPKIRIAIIDKDEPGGVCLIRGCVPSKRLIYPGLVIRNIEHAEKHGINVNIENIDYKSIMRKVQREIHANIQKTKRKFDNAPQIDFYQDIGTFIEKYVVKIGDEIIRGQKILLCLGSKTFVPPIVNLGSIEFHTSKTIFLKNSLPELPGRILIIGGGYIAAELGHFYSAMGSKVTIIGRNSQFLPQEEPEVSKLARNILSKYLTIITDSEVIEAEGNSNGKSLIIRDRRTGDTRTYTSDEVIIATGRESNSNLLQPQNSGVKIDERGWIIVNDYLETTQKNIYAFGDANGKFLLKHKANYETEIVYKNAFLNQENKVDYHAIPHAVFTYPEIAGVGLRQKEAIEKYGEENILTGSFSYENTAYGRAMESKDFFVKVIVKKSNSKILGAHIIGPYASILIQEIITQMYTKDGTFDPILNGMHIHPSLSQVVERAFAQLQPVREYNPLN